MTVKKKILISIIVVTIVIGLIIYFIIFPTINDIKKINDTIYAERVDLEKKYLRGQLLKKTVQDFEKIKPEKYKLTSVFIIEGEELQFITALENIVATHNLTQDIQLQQAPDKKDDFYSLSLKIKTQGEFIDTLKYLKDLEQLNYYFNIFSIQINATGKERDQKDKLITTNLDGKIYTLSAEKE